jgi:hypothetical protein
MAPWITHFQFTGNAVEKHPFHPTSAQLQQIGTKGFFKK